MKFLDFRQRLRKPAARTPAGRSHLHDRVALLLLSVLCIREPWVILPRVRLVSLPPLSLLFLWLHFFLQLLPVILFLLLFLIIVGVEVDGSAADVAASPPAGRSRCGSIASVDGVGTAMSLGGLTVESAIELRVKGSVDDDCLLVVSEEHLLGAARALTVREKHLHRGALEESCRLLVTGAHHSGELHARSNVHTGQLIPHVDLHLDALVGLAEQQLSQGEQLALVLGVLFRVTEQGSVSVHRPTSDEDEVLRLEDSLVDGIEGVLLQLLPRNRGRQQGVSNVRILEEADAVSITLRELAVRDLLVGVLLAGHHRAHGTSHEVGCR
mmetsp:Transcript_129345/g.182370  ORF Transcript_129345/g.182370 Transcript_129345/m.182370 type:complete len:326 (+) Transcript_129345:613-1590(+)